MDIIKLNDILRQMPYFTKQNLALALNKEGENLNYWIKKLIKERRLVVLKKGFFISSYFLDLTSQNPSEKEAYFEYLANILYFPSYVSLEYVLSNNGIIPESVFAMTSITHKTTRTYKTQVGAFIFRNIKESLFNNYQTKDFDGKKVNIASVAKALFDFLYLKNMGSPTETEKYLLNQGRINWEAMSNRDKIEFIKLVKTSGSKKMEIIVSLLKKEQIL